MSSSQSRRRWPRVLAGIVSCCVLALTGVAAVGVYFAQGLASNIKAGTDGNFTSDDFQPTPGAPINILLMGSDTREGSNSKGYGNKNVISGARSDTTILLHISGDRTRALAVSIPRDSRVKLPTCKMPNGQIGGGEETRFNEAFDIGGPGCTVKAVRELTGVDIDHYIVVDFTGFKGIVNALDGVEVCLAKPVYDKEAKLDLQAGRQVVRGEQALAFVRARMALADGTDIARIERQQDFLSSAIRKATSMDVVSNPKKLYEVLSAGTKSLTADPGLANFDSIKDLALNVSTIKPSDITFATVPFTYDPPPAGTVTWTPSQSNELWNVIKNDQQWPPPPTNGVDGKPLTAAPKSITVDVENGSGVPGQGKRAQELLTSEGYQPGYLKSASANGPSAILFNPEVASQAAAARTLQVSTGILPTPTSKSTGSSITLVVGNDFDYTLDPVRVKVEPSAAVAAAKPRTAAGKPICAS